MPLGRVRGPSCVVVRRRDARCPDRLREPRDLSISVNRSPRQLTHPTQVQDLERALSDADLGAGSLIVEITESAVIQDLDGAVATLEAIRALGVRVALDDFGTGYSSLKFLTTLPMDVVKIDRGFVAGLGRATRARRPWSGRSSSWPRCSASGRSARGSRRAPRRMRSRRSAATWAQGFYFSRPLGAEGLGALLRSDTRRQRHRASVG